MTTDEMLKAAERVINLERMFNVSEGFERRDDVLPQRLTKEAAPDGLGKGQVVKMDIVLDEFYKTMDWDLKTGIPKKEKLKELGLI
jgi:aldehyde:ferredoxin oxidoreductase